MSACGCRGFIGLMGCLRVWRHGRGACSWDRSVGAMVVAIDKACEEFRGNQAWPFLTQIAAQDKALPH